MMSIVYIVTSGSYSDYGIVAVFSTKEKAEAFIEQRRQTECYDHDDNEIEEWTLDEESGKVARALFSCFLQAESGDVVHEQGRTELAPPTARGMGTTIMDCFYKDRGVFKNVIKAESYVSAEHAKKLAVEARQQLRAGMPRSPYERSDG